MFGSFLGNYENNTGAKGVLFFLWPHDSVLKYDLKLCFWGALKLETRLLGVFCFLWPLISPCALARQMVCSRVAKTGYLAQRC
jgi:hypothetical protein